MGYYHRQLNKHVCVFYSHLAYLPLCILTNCACYSSFTSSIQLFLLDDGDDVDDDEGGYKDHREDAA